MITEEKRRAVLAAIEQVQDEAAFNQILAVVERLLQPVAEQPAGNPPGFMRGSVIYRTDDWDAPLPDADWKHNSAE